jgi:hypothetical protein
LGEFSLIGRTFVDWAIVFFLCSFKKSCKSSPHLWGNIFARKKLCVDFDKNGFGYFFGDFLTNASSHPVWHPVRTTKGPKMPPMQGDKIGRIFAYCAIADFGAFLLQKKLKRLGYFCHRKSYVFILTKKWLGPYFGRFFHELIRSPCFNARWYKCSARLT